MGYLSGVFRAIPGAAAESGVTVTLKDSGGSTITTVSTDSSGLWTYQPNGTPNSPVSWEATVSGQTRKGSSQTRPMAGSLSVAELPMALAAIPDGIIDGYANELALSNGTGRTVTVATGAAIVAGVPFVNYSAESNHDFGITTPASSTRKDRLYLKVSRIGQTDEGAFTYGRVAGSEGGGIPSLPSNTSAAAYISLGSASTTTGGVVTLTSETARSLSGVVARAARSVARKDRSSTSAVTTSSTTPADITELAFTEADFSPSLDATKTYDLSFVLWVSCKSSIGNTGISIAPYATIGGVQTIAPYVDNRQTSYVGIMNALGGVSTSDGTVSGGALIKRTGNNNNVSYEMAFLEVTATPRS